MKKHQTMLSWRDYVQRENRKKALYIAYTINAILLLAVAGLVGVIIYLQHVLIRVCSV